MPAEYPYLLMLLYQVPHVLVLALFLAATVVAARRARGHVAWLALMTVGWGVGLVGAVISINLPRYAQASGASMRQLTPLLAVQQGLSVLGSLCFVVGSVLLLLRLLAPPEPGRP